MNKSTIEQQADIIALNEKMQSPEFIQLTLTPEFKTQFAVVASTQNPEIIKSFMQQKAEKVNNTPEKTVLQDAMATVQTKSEPARNLDGETGLLSEALQTLKNK